MTSDGSPLPTPLPDLPTDLAACHALILQLLHDQQQKARAIDRLEYKVQDLLRRLYGRSSEKIDPKQLALFVEVLEDLKAQAPRPPEPPAAPPTRTGRFWVYLGDDGHPYDVFTYTPNRSRDGPRTFLAGWGQGERRYLQADAFGGYDGIYAGEVGASVTEVACWAHARRKFHEAERSDGAASAQALAYIRLLYDVEDRARGQPASERARLRQEFVLPRLHQFKAWLESQQALRGGPVLPKSPMGQAIQYALNQWDALSVYVTDGDLDIDNNMAERALRRVAVGRKNWLFCGSDKGGTTAAILFSLISTCQRHHVDPLAYLRDVLTRIAAQPYNRLADLLPDRWMPAPLAPSAEPSPAAAQAPARP